MTRVLNIQTDGQSDLTASHGWIEPCIFAICPLTPSVVSRTLSTWSFCPSSASQPRRSRTLKLEPSLEGLLLSANVKPQIIGAIRVQEFTSIDLMVALMKTCKQAFGIDTEAGDFAPQERMGKAQHCVEASEDHMRHQRPCGRRQKGAGRTRFFPDSRLDVFVTRVLATTGKDPGQRTASTELLRSFEESLHDGTLQAEPLAHVVSIAEEQTQRAVGPGPPTEFGLHLDSTLTVQTKRPYMSSMPSNTKALCTKYEVLTNRWLLAQSRQPGRKMYADFTERTYTKFLKNC